jgi:DNA-directed RNA polymerase specialized sigma24 family protein
VAYQPTIDRLTDDALALLCGLVRSAVSELPRDEERVIRWLYWDERSHGDIARDTGTSWQVVKRTEEGALNRLHRGLAPVYRIMTLGPNLA